MVGASTDNDLVLVDLKTFQTRKLNLAPGVAKSTGGGGRHVEWAVDSNYVWVNDGEAKEAYIIKITGGIQTTSLSKTLTSVAAGTMLFVCNYGKRERMKAEFAKAASTFVASSASSSSSKKESESELTPSSSNASSSLLEDGGDEVVDSDNVLSVVGVILGALGLLARISALALVSSAQKASAASDLPKTNDVKQATDVKTLGSKRVS